MRCDEIAGAGGNFQPIETPFDKSQRDHARKLLTPLRFVHRDLLRLLLIKGGSARNDVISRARRDNGPIDFNALLIGDGLITRGDDRTNGHSTYFVNASMIDLLKGALFPRVAMDETDPPYFTGI